MNPRPADYSGIRGGGKVTLLATLTLSHLREFVQETADFTGGTSIEFQSVNDARWYMPAGLRTNNEKDAK